MKNRIHFIVAGCAAALLFSFAIVACGEGTVEELDTMGVQDVADAIYTVNGEGKIARCFVGNSNNAEWNEKWCEELKTEPVLTPSSSSEPPPPPPPPSNEDCLETIPDAGMECKWANVSNPGGTIISGDEIKFDGKVYNGSEPCKERVYLSVKMEITPGAINTDYFDAEYDFYSNEDKDKKTTTSGPLSVKEKNGGSRTGTFNWPNPAAGVSTPVVTNPAAIYAKVECLVGEDKLLCGTKNCTSTLRVTGAPNPTGVTGTVSFTNVDYSSGSSSYFYIGTKPEFTGNVAVNNPEQSRCTEIVYKVMRGNTDITGKALTEADIGNITLKSYCNNGVELTGTGRTAAAAVVPNPTLGECTWGSKTTLVVGATATPSATPSYAYGRCGAGDGEVTYSGGFPRTLVIGDVGNITGIKATMSCSSGDVEKTCGTLKVVEFENELEMKNDKSTIVVEQGKSYTITTTCTGNNNFFALVCPHNQASEGCSVKIGATTYSGVHNNSPGCRVPSPAVGSVVEIIKANPNMQVKCEDQYNGSLCTTN